MRRLLRPAKQLLDHLIGRAGMALIDRAEAATQAP